MSEKPKGTRRVRATAARLAIRRGEFVQLRRRLLDQTWLWFVVFVVAAVVIVSPWKPREYPALEAGEVAQQDIVVDRDVTLPDPESTEQKRQRASAEVLPVYLFDKSVGEQMLARLDTLFQVGRENGSGSQSELAARLSDATGMTVTPAEAALLRQARFGNDLLATLREVAERMYRQGIVADRTELLRSADRGVVLRYVGNNVERVDLDVYRFIDASSGLTEAVEQRLAAEASIPRRWRTALAALMGRAMAPNVVFDRGETLTRRLKAAAQVEEVVVRLPRGRVLVRRGDEVTPQMARLLKALAARRSSSSSTLPAIGITLLTVLLALTWLFYLRRQSSVRDEFRARFGAVVILSVMALLVERGTAFLAGGVAASVMRDPFGHIGIYLPALPHAAGPILAGLMFGLPVAVLFAVIQGVLVALMLGGDVAVAIYALIGGMAAAFASQRLKDRNVLARAGIIVAAVNVVAVLGLALWHGKIADGMVLAVEMGSAALGGVVAAAMASFLLPVMESLTGSITDIRLLELSNPNLPLLRRLASEAPGTFQHTLTMANLAEAAAEAIGANPLLARVCCYYHDVGKLGKPDYFVENQRGDNPHDHLTPWMSALVVSNHVKNGLELARQYKLPEPIREAITSHHGTKLIRYFYSRAKEREEPDRGEVQETEFRYPGPKPSSKEMGILLLADSVEAAARTLKNPSGGRIQGMIDQIIKNSLDDGQLDECDLTLKDLEKISAAFLWVLTSAFHHRIDYPGFDFNGKQQHER